MKIFLIRMIVVSTTKIELKMTEVLHGRRKVVKTNEGLNENNPIIPFIIGDGIGPDI